MPTPIPNWLPTKPTRIAVAMSGGVDSTVAAYLLHQAGHEIVGFTAWTLNGPGTCCNDALVNAGRVCEQLGVPFDTVDLRAEFHHYVLDYYNRSYAAGLTPNPCVECNRYVKWEKLIDYAKTQLDAEYVATGHYVRRGEGGEIYRAVDAKKDQTYMLARVRPKDLQSALFPLGDMTKPDVVKLAQQAGLPNADAAESMDVCFVLDGQANYLRGALGTKKGPIVDLDSGRVVGEHDGHYLFTRGQRKGVQVAAGRPIYVVKTDAASNTVYVGDKHHLETTVFQVKNVNWLVTPPALPATVAVKTRYASQPSQAELVSLGADTLSDDFRVTLHTPQDAVTPGQIAVFYDPTFSQLLGGGFIEQYLPHPPFDAATAAPPPTLTCTK